MSKFTAYKYYSIIFFLFLCLYAKYCAYFIFPYMILHAYLAWKLRLAYISWNNVLYHYDDFMPTELRDIANWLSHRDKPKLLALHKYWDQSNSYDIFSEIFRAQTYQMSYSSVTVALILSVGISFILYGLAKILNPRDFTKDIEQLSEYECGFAPFDQALQNPFDVHFYIVGVLFLIFDIEIAYFYPWLVSAHCQSAYGWYLFMSFFIILLLGFLYEWQLGALTWVKDKQYLYFVVAFTEIDFDDYYCWLIILIATLCTSLATQFNLANNVYSATVEYTNYLSRVIFQQQQWQEFITFFTIFITFFDLMTGELEYFDIWCGCVSIFTALVLQSYAFDESSVNWELTTVKASILQTINTFVGQIEDFEIIWDIILGFTGLSIITVVLLGQGSPAKLILSNSVSYNILGDVQDRPAYYYLVSVLGTMMLVTSISVVENPNSIVDFWDYNLIDALMFYVFLKVGAAPFSTWMIEVYYNADDITLYILMTVIKFAYLGFLCTLTDSIDLDDTAVFILWITGVASILYTLGVIFLIKNLKYMLVCASMAQIGYFCIALTISDVLADFYVSVYFILITFLMSLLILKPLLANSKLLFIPLVSNSTALWLRFTKSVTDSMLIYQNLLVILLLLALAGLPPFIGFFAKFLLLVDAYGQADFSNIFIIIGFSVLTVFYYVRSILFVNTLQR